MPFLFKWKIVTLCTIKKDYPDQLWKYRVKAKISCLVPGLDKLVSI